MRKSNTRDKILKVAKDMFRDYGYTNSTTKEIAIRAEVNEVTLFRHFGSKELLFKEVMSIITTAAVFNEEFTKRFTGDLKTDLTIFAVAYLKSAEDRIMNINIGLMEGPKDPEMGRLVGLIALNITDFLAAHLLKLHQQGVIPNNDFHLASQMMYSILYQYIICNYSMCGAKNIMQVDQEIIVRKSVEVVQHMLT